MDFLIVCVAILIIALISRFFFKTILVASVLGILIYVVVPQNIKNKMNSIVNLRATQKVINSGLGGLFNISKNAAIKINNEAINLKKK